MKTKLILGILICCSLSCLWGLSFANDEIFYSLEEGCPERLDCQKVDSGYVVNACDQLAYDLSVPGRETFYYLEKGCPPLLVCFDEVNIINIGNIHSCNTIDAAIQRGYGRWLTRYTTSVEFRPNDSIRRDEFSKFITVFLDHIGRSPGWDWQTNSCTFSDIRKSYDDLQEYVLKACEFAIIKGNKWYVMPDKNLTNAEFITIMARLTNTFVDGYGDEDITYSYNWISHWASKYYNSMIAQGFDIDVFNDMDAAATRGNVLKMLYKIRYINH